MNITDVKTDLMQYTPLPLPKTALLKPSVEAIVFDKWVVVGMRGETLHFEITLKNHSDLDIKINFQGHFIVNKLFYIHNYKVARYVSFYHLENHPKIICCDMINSVSQRFFFNLDVIVPEENQIRSQEFYPIIMKQDNDDIIPKISEECYQKKAAVRQLLLSLEDENSAFSQNGILKDIIILIGKQFAMQYEKILQDQAKMLEQHK